MQALKFGFGQSIPRKEDEPLLRGHGRYIADVEPRDTLHAVVIRSPRARARFRVDAAKAREMPGVRLVLTGSETLDVGPLPCTVELPTTVLDVPPYPILAHHEVRHVGDAIAFVVADTLERAKDAAEAITVTWEDLPHVIGAIEALKPGAPRVWPERPDNIVFDVTLGDKTATDQAFAKAVVSLTLVNQRLVANYLDTRGVVADYDAAHGRVTLTLSSQGPQSIRDVLVQVLNLPAEKLRVMTPDVGGGFGTKLFPYREYALAAVATCHAADQLAINRTRSCDCLRTDRCRAFGLAARAGEHGARRYRPNLPPRTDLPANRKILGSNCTDCHRQPTTRSSFISEINLQTAARRGYERRTHLRCPTSGPDCCYAHNG